MKRKVAKFVVLALFLVAVASAIFSKYKMIVCGNQRVIISISGEARANSDLCVSIVAEDKYNKELESQSKIQLLNSKGKKVKDTKISYDGNTAKISIPEIEKGIYIIKAKVFSKAGKDTIKKEIYITDENPSVYTAQKRSVIYTSVEK